MTDKARIRILRRELKRVGNYLNDVHDLLSNSDTWSEDPSDGLGRTWRGIQCAIHITRRKRSKKNPPWFMVSPYKESTLFPRPKRR